MEQSERGHEPSWQEVIAQQDAEIERLRGALAQCEADKQAAIDAAREIAEYLIEQRDEPDMFSASYDRVHYWRDKAITAARRLRALDTGAGR